MILEFSFTNFGPVSEEVTLSFEATSDDTLADYYIYEQEDGKRLLKLGIIYGPNASGKSTVLEALELMRDLVVHPKEQKSERIGYQKHLIGEDYLGKSSQFKMVFYANGIKHDYKVNFHNDKISKEELYYYPNRRQAEMFSRETSGDVSHLEFGSTIDLTKKEALILEGNTLKNNTVLGSYSKSNISNKDFDNVYNWFYNQLMPLISPETKLFGWTSNSMEENKIKKEQLIELLKKADLNISDMEIIEEKLDLDDHLLNQIDLLPISDDEKEEIIKNRGFTAKNVLFKHSFKGEDDNELSFSIEKEWESNGTLRYYGLAGPVLSALKNGQILSIDELDTSLHPDLMKHFVLTYLANSKNSQLMFTTHNIAFLKERDILRNDVVWFTEKNKKGAANLFSVADFSSKEIRKDSSIFNAYNLGKLGAKPNPAGIFLD